MRSVSLCAGFMLLLLLPAGAQKVRFSELDTIRGLFFVPNTPKPFSGTAYEEHPNGQKLAEIPIREGKMHGIVREWDIAGHRIAETRYEQGKKNGPELQWYENGQKKLEINNINGRAEGICTEWHKNGRKKSEGRYASGREEGRHDWWFDTGIADQLITYEHGLAEGTAKNWHANGILKTETAYHEGKKNGPATEWHDNGLKKSEGRYRDGKPEGAFRTWSRTGQLLGIQTFENGQIVSDLNYRSGNIEISNGFLEVFNKPEGAFTLTVTGTSVKPRKAEVPTYNLDGKLLQLYTIHTDSIRGTNTQDEAAILSAYMESESAFIRKMTKANINVTSATGKTDNGKTYLHWHFPSPYANVKERQPRTVLEEHYLSTVCGKYVLSLYSVVTASDKTDDIVQMLARLAGTITTYEHPLELNELSHQAAKKN